MTLHAVDVLKLLDGKPLVNVLAECRIEANRHVWFEGVELLRRFADLIKQGHPTLASGVAAAGLLWQPYENDPDLLFYRALARVNAGNPTTPASFGVHFLPLLHWTGDEGKSICKRDICRVPAPVTAVPGGPEADA